MTKGGSVYIIANKNNNVLYVGVTSDLIGRIKKHKDKFYPKSFSAKYNCDKLVYFERFHSIQEAIAREKQIKKYRREKKDALINLSNPAWRDLYEDILFW